MAVRLAIGAGRRRLVTQLLTEALLLSGLGGVAGFFLAQWTLGLILRLQPNVGVTFTLNTSPDIRGLLFSFAVVGLAAILFGLTPALAATKEGISPTLAAGMEARRGRVLGLRGGLVALQMAVSVILLTGAGLFFHSLVRAQGTDPGFRAENGVAVWVDMERSGLPREAWARTMEAIRARAAAQPGVQELGVADLLPLGSRNTAEFHIPGVEPPEGRESHWANVFRIDEGYLGTMGIPVLSGRGIQALDGEGAQSVVVVSQAAARRFWPEESPLGKDVTVASTDQTFQVVGVVGDVKVERLGDSPEPTFYFSLAQNPSAETYLVARGTGPNVELISSLRRAVAEVDPDLLVMLSQTLEERVGVNLYPARMAALFLGGAGALALLLAAIGLYGVVSLSVSRRTREVGIRMSLGADARRVVGTVLRGSLTSVALGAIIGLALAIVGARLIRSFLFGVDPADPATLVAVPLLLGTVAAVAALIPALRASRVDPVEALREE
mgnify:CR=1 FL=1